MASDAATLHDIGVAGMAKPEAGVKGLMVWAGAKRGVKGQKVRAGPKPA